MVSDREAILRILGQFTNATAREIARIGGFPNTERLREVLVRMSNEGILTRRQDQEHEDGAEGTRVWRFAIATPREHRERRARSYEPSAARVAEGRALWHTAAILLVGLLAWQPAYAQTPLVITDPATAEMAWTNVDLRVTSFLCKVGPNNPAPGAWDAVAGFQCGNLPKPDAAATEHTWPLPPDLKDGDYLVAVNACAPGECSGYTAAVAFTVSRTGTPPPPPPPPPPTGIAKPILITVRQRASASAAPAALPRATAGTRTTTATVTADPLVLLSVPFTANGITRICLHGADGTTYCHNADWWLNLIPPAKRP